MDPKLREIFKVLGVSEDETCYINNEGKVMKRGLLGDEYTKVFIDEDGRIMKEKLLGNEFTGYILDNEGNFKKDAILGYEDTGVYLDEKNQFRVKTLLGGAKTGYFIDKEGFIKKEGIFESPPDKADPIYKRDFSRDIRSEEDDSGLISLVFYLVLIVIAIYILFYAVLIGFVSLPALGLGFYYFKKKNWLISSGLLVSAYMLLDVFMLKFYAYKVITGLFGHEWLWAFKVGYIFVFTAFVFYFVRNRYNQ